ncbi:phosphatidylserine decarboxylase 2 [Colletotrichum asianum]
MFIQADNPKIGLMAVVFIGMVEVSSCDFVVGEGERIEKGQEIGMFHFGGSSYCMVFRPGVELQMVRPGPWDMDREHNFAVKSALAIVS